MNHERLNQIHAKLLMGPGPSMVYPSVYEAMQKPVIGHLDPEFIAIMDEVKAMLRVVLNTKNEMTIPISGTGSAGMETCFVNLVSPGNRVLILSNGVFGGRMQDVASRLGAEVDVLEEPWGQPIIPSRVEEKLKEKPYDLVAMVHAETSTGVLNPVQEVGALLANTDSLFLVDAVTSLGGLEIQMDAWGIDALYSGTQKCLSVPPGLSPVSFSEKAMSVLASRTQKVPNWYLDLSLITQYWGGGAQRVYHHTAPITMMYALYQALSTILDEGLSNVYARHQRAHEELVQGLEEVGLSLLVAPEYRLPMLNAIQLPEGFNEAEVRQWLLNEKHIEVGAGLGPLAGKIWRVGIMGETARSIHIQRLIQALSEKRASWS